MYRLRGWLLPVLGLALVGGASILGEPSAKERRPETLHLPHANLVSQAVFSPDGKLLATCGHEGRVRLWDAATGQELRQWRGEEYRTRCVAFSPDGKVLAAPLTENVVSLFDPATGKELRRLQGEVGAVQRVAFAPDGKTLAAGDSLSPVHLWDVATGKCLRRLDGGPGSVNALAFSPDGRVLASGSQGAALVLWDPPTGNMLRRLLGHTAPVRALAFSPDGRTMASAGDDPMIRLWETATGQERGRLGGESYQVLDVAFSPDGKTLASGGWDNVVRLWDLATETEHRPLAVRSQQAWVLAFSPDGRKLATIDTQNSARTWDLSGLSAARRPAAPLSRKELEALWTDLCGDSAPAAYRAIRSLAAVPGQAVPLVRQRLEPIAAPAAGEIARLIADLDNDRFAVREKATRELARLGHWAEADLRRTLAGRPPLEVRRRVEQILGESQERGLSVEQVHGLRALEVLERADTPEARQALRALAEGAPDARLTQDARASLERLARRATVP